MTDSTITPTLRRMNELVAEMAASYLDLAHAQQRAGLILLGQGIRAVNEAQSRQLESSLRLQRAFLLYQESVRSRTEAFVSDLMPPAREVVPRAESPAGTPATPAVAPEEGLAVEIVVRAPGSATPTPVLAHPSRTARREPVETAASREDLMDAVMVATGTDAATAGQVIDILFHGVRDALAAGEEVRLRHFGTFKVVATRARVGTNPRTGERIMIAAGRKPVFHPSRELREAIPQGSLPEAR
ncbi:MAG TPA: HU family DNA-binding protein [Chloroflexota bacterium]|nr:HU family DNA-binding protein [Chloroflexota bacterium]